MKLAIVGATGLVGQTMLKVLEERNFPVDELILVASERSVGKKYVYNGEEYVVVSMQDALALEPDIALFSAGGSVSKKWAPEFAALDCIVIDNSSAWRMDPTKNLVVPEVNGHVVTSDDKIIANPNCSTIQMVMALWPLHRKWNINRIVVSTYQSISGTGMDAVRQYYAEKEGEQDDSLSVYPHPIFANCLPHCDIFLDNNYTKEEMKLVDETRKIMNTPDLGVSSTAVRVPVLGGHSESVNVEFERAFEIEEIKSTLEGFSGIKVLDDPSRNLYPMPLYAKDSDLVYVGRLRKDDSIANGLNLWIVSDNLRKGAATNAIQIAEMMLKNELIKPKVLSEN